LSGSGRTRGENDGFPGTPGAARGEASLAVLEAVKI
jgi:hypothetical protein